METTMRTTCIGELVMNPISNLCSPSDFSNAADGETVFLLDSSTICDCDLPNRDPSSFTSREFFELQASIRTMGRNLEPIKVRRLNSISNYHSFLYEVIFGHRRLRACQNLSLPIHAIIVDGISTRQILIERVAENSGRASFTALEFGRICAEALDSGKEQLEIAQEFGKDEGLVSRALALARLPDQVIGAFESPADLQYRHATPLGKALRLDRDAVLLIAVQMAQEPGPRPPAVVLRRLTSQVLDAAVEPFNRPPGTRRLTCRGKVVGTLNVDGKGLVSVTLKRPLDEAGIEALEKALVHIVAKTSAARPSKSRANAREAL
jgi:ParB family transcriptional regulator, chromosome partitioning protein